MAGRIPDLDINFPFVFTRGDGSKFLININYNGNSYSVTEKRDLEQEGVGFLQIPEELLDITASSTMQDFIEALNTDGKYTTILSKLQNGEKFFMMGTYTVVGSFVMSETEALMIFVVDTENSVETIGVLQTVGSSPSVSIIRKSETKVLSNDIYKIQKVTSYPATPDNNTLYIKVGA